MEYNVLKKLYLYLRKFIFCDGNSKWFKIDNVSHFQQWNVPAAHMFGKRVWEIIFVTLLEKCFYLFLSINRCSTCFEFPCFNVHWQIFLSKFLLWNRWFASHWKFGNKIIFYDANLGHCGSPAPTSHFTFFNAKV